MRTVVMLVIYAALAAGSASAESESMSKQLVTSSNSTAFKLHRQFSSAGGNLVFSPFSIQSAAALIYAGAEGETAAELASVFGFPKVRGDLGSGYRELSASLAGGEEYELHTANGLWRQQGSEFSESYLSFVEERFAAEIRTADFQTDPDASRKLINTWVAKQTRGRIDSLFPQGSIDQLARLVLANAVYFKGAWRRPFDESETIEAPFYTAEGSSPMPFMQQSGLFFCGEADGVKMLHKPYGGDRLSLLILLPTKRDGLRALEGSLNPAVFSRMTSNLKMRLANVSLPRFKTSAAPALADAMQKLGVKQAFTAAADFSAMSGGKEDFHLAAAVHKAEIEVNEEGTEASAATGMVAATGMPAEPPLEFKADHPFLFILRDHRSGLILFMGRFAGPA